MKLVRGSQLLALGLKSYTLEFKKSFKANCCFKESEEAEKVMSLTGLHVVGAQRGFKENIV